MLFSAKIILCMGLTLILVDKDSNTAGLQEKTLMQLLKMPSLKYATCDGKICRDSGSYTYWESVSANYKCARAYFCGCPELKCIGQSRYSI